MLKSTKEALFKIPVVRGLIRTIKGKTLRARLSYKYIKGNGIEIGALHLPLIYSKAKANVTYVDRLTESELKKHYPGLDGFKWVNVDVVDDGETLSTFASESLDFIIANHMLEHCRNPIKTIHTHIKKIKKGGILYYAIPDKRYSFDKLRTLTTFEHLVEDYYEKNDHFQHYIEWSRYCNELKNESEIKSESEHLFNIGYSIHYHTWTLTSFQDFLNRTNNFNTNKPLYEISFYSKNKTEIIAILTKA
jgi:2-polyprenyl-3-methyl-5-hydroxy-6-metoxy-1,4-benzoquinol methylase